MYAGICTRCGWRNYLFISDGGIWREESLWKADGRKKGARFFISLILAGLIYLFSLFLL